MNAAEKRAERQRIEEEAASLVVDRFGCGDDAAAATATALCWAARSPVHGVALAQAQAAWAAAERLRAVAAHDERADPAIRRSVPRPSRRIMLAGGIAAAAALPVALGVGQWFGGQRLSTAIGERRSFALDNGSTVHLNTDTLIELATERGRHVATLVRGEAMFDVATAAARPLIVMVGPVMLRAARTAFDLSIYDDLAELVVATGAVTLVGEKAARSIAAGSSAAIKKGAVAVVALPTAMIDQRLAWRRGVIDLDGRTLGQAAAEFSRYRTRPIIVADLGLASLRLGGTFATDDGEAFVDAVQRSFPIAAVKTDDGSILLVPVSCAKGRIAGQPCTIDAATHSP